MNMLTNDHIIDVLNDHQPVVRGQRQLGKLRKTTDIVLAFSQWAIVFRGLPCGSGVLLCAATDQALADIVHAGHVCWPRLYIGKIHGHVRSVEC
jgi:hypothetical protein